MRDRSLPPFWQTYGPDGDCRRSSVEAFVEIVEDANWYRKKNLLALRKCEGGEDFVDDMDMRAAALPTSRCTAASSISSPIGVDVPCALM